MPKYVEWKELQLQCTAYCRIQTNKPDIMHFRSKDRKPNHDNRKEARQFKSTLNLLIKSAVACNEAAHKAQW